MQHDDRLIVALDFPTLEQAKACVVELGDAVSYYKVGMELYYAVGSEIIRFLKEQGKHVFLDLKLQDIPNTVAHALTVLSDLGADMMNVHAVGGKKMMAEAVKAVHEAAEAAGRPAPKLIAVTILTSMDDEQFADLNYKNTISFPYSSSEHFRQTGQQTFLRCPYRQMYMHAFFLRQQSE